LGDSRGRCFRFGEEIAVFLAAMQLRPSNLSVTIATELQELTSFNMYLVIKVLTSSSKSASPMGKKVGRRFTQWQMDWDEEQIN